MALRSTYISKAALKLIKSVMKKKKKGSVPKGQAKTSSTKKSSKSESTMGPWKKVIERKTEGTAADGKKVKVIPTNKKSTTPKKMNTAEKKAASKKRMKNIPKKADKKITGSGSQSARPIGSKGKTKSQDSPKGSVAGTSMGSAKKKQMRDTALDKMSTKTDKDGVSPRMKRAYQDISKRQRDTLLFLIKSGNSDRIRKAFAKVDLTPSEFLRVRKKFTGG